MTGQITMTAKCSACSKARRANALIVGTRNRSSAPRALLLGAAWLHDKKTEASWSGESLVRWTISAGLNMPD